ncbi:hypothetical protein C8R45DRAFT_1003797 [Mycena sanguinolenta]|nr:hypothetical protein C8R45DRAFT_1003797 [Mycena sanguinolenta]
MPKVLDLLGVGRASRGRYSMDSDVVDVLRFIPLLSLFHFLYPPTSGLPPALTCIWRHPIRLKYLCGSRWTHKDSLALKVVRTRRNMELSHGQAVRALKVDPPAPASGICCLPVDLSNDRLRIPPMIAPRTCSLRAADWRRDGIWQACTDGEVLGSG